jgi:NAD+ kinase
LTASFPAIGVVAKDDPAAHAVAAELARWLARRGHAVALDEESRRALEQGDEGAGDPAGGPAGAFGVLDPGARCDLVIVLGGDGTLLSIARRYAGSSPILGVNLGFLGYLTEVGRDGLYPALLGILAGRYTLEARTLLEATLERAGEAPRTYLALNDVVIAKTAPSRIIELELTVDGKPLSRYRADGLVVSTPTGSTAYNLSAGGPILHPQLPVTVLTPICPHTLTLRPLVLPDSSTIEIRLVTPSEMVFLTVDGQEGAEIAAGDLVRIHRHAEPVQLVRTAEPRSIFEGLRSKLHWGE